MTHYQQEAPQIHSSPWLAPILKFAGEKKKTVMGAAFVLVLLVATVFGNTFYQARRDRTALDLYDRALAKEGEARQQALEDLVQKYPQAAVSALVRLELARQAFDAGEYEKALSWYEPVTHVSNDKVFLKISALHGMGFSAWKLKDYKKAEQAFQEAAANPKNITRDLSRYHLASLYEEQGDLEKAKGLYQNLAENSELRAVKEDAEGHLLLLTHLPKAVQGTP